MTSTLRRQLAEIGMEDRWHDVLDELPRVREELGWPIMVTPLSQFVGVQAFLNVSTGERWSQIPDEIVKYVLGHYGGLRRVRSIPTSRRGARLAARRAVPAGGAPASISPRRARATATRISDEELLLRMTLPAGAGGRDRARGARRRPSSRAARWSRSSQRLAAPRAARGRASAAPGFACGGCAG